MSRVDRHVIDDAARTTVAAVVSLFAARLVGIPEAYWAPISTIIVMQSTLGAAMTVSRQRLAGTVLGAATGALLGTYFPANVAMFGVGLFALGLIAALLKLEVAYRFAGVTLAITMLIPRDRPAWEVAEHRLVQVSLGIAIALLVTVVWPERK